MAGLFRRERQQSDSHGKSIFVPEWKGNKMVYDLKTDSETFDVFQLVSAYSSGLFGDGVLEVVLYKSG